MQKRWIGFMRCIIVLLVCLLLGPAKNVNAKVVDAQPDTQDNATTETTTSESDGWDSSKNYYYEKGKKVTGFKKIDNKLYYFQSNGKLYKKTGVRTIQGKKYCFASDYSIKTGVVKVGKKYYYFQKSTGVRYEKKGVKKVDGKYYCFTSKHYLKSGWYRNSKNKRYYFDKKTFEAKIGWNYIGKYKYFFEKNGQLCQDLRKKLSKQIKKQKKDKNAYLIKVNRAASCVTVYAKDGDKGYTIPVVAFVCSAGQATPTGTFKLKDKLRWHELMGPCWGQWCEHLTDDILFHSVYYNKENDNKSLSVSAYNKLGTMASHGCVRLTAGDAKWIFDNCAVGTKVTIYNKKKEPSPFDKPKAKKLKSSQTWDPTDPTIKKK